MTQDATFTFTHEGETRQGTVSPNGAALIQDDKIGTLTMNWFTPPGLLAQHGLSLPFPAGVKVVQDGDSRFQLEGSSQSHLSSYSAGGALITAHQLDPRFATPAIYPSNDPRGFSGANQGLSGDYTSGTSPVGFTSRMAECLGMSPSILFIGGGTNNAVASADPTAEKNDLITMGTQCDTALVVPIFSNIYAAPSLYDNQSTFNTNRAVMNSNLDTVIAAHPGWYKLDADAVIDPDHDGNADNAAYYDGPNWGDTGAFAHAPGANLNSLHPGPISGYRIGKALNAILSTLIQSGNIYTDAGGIWKGTNWALNPTFTGTDGAVTGSQCSGTVAHGFNLHADSGVASTCVASIVANGDGTFKQRLTFTPSGSATSERFYLSETAYWPNPAAGSTVIIGGGAQVYINGSNPFLVKGEYKWQEVYTYLSGGLVEFTGTGVADATHRHYCQTPPYKLSGSQAGINGGFTFYLNPSRASGATPVVIDLEFMWGGVVADPTVAFPSQTRTVSW